MVPPHGKDDTRGIALPYKNNSTSKAQQTAKRVSRNSIVTLLDTGKLPSVPHSVLSIRLLQILHHLLHRIPKKNPLICSRQTISSPSVKYEANPQQTLSKLPPKSCFKHGAGVLFAHYLSSCPSSFGGHMGPTDYDTTSIAP